MASFNLNEKLQGLKNLKSLDPKTIWLWPAAPRYGVLGALVLFILIAGYFGIISPEQDNLATAEQKTETLKKEYAEKFELATNLEAYKKLRAETEVVFEASLRQLPSKSEMEALLTDIHQAGLGRGLTFEYFKPSEKENTFEFYAELPIQLKVEGTYHDIAEFNAAIAKLSRIVTINDIEIISAPNNNKQRDPRLGPPPLKMSMSAIAKTYRYLDDSEVQARQKQMAADNKGKGKGKPPAKDGAAK